VPCRTERGPRPSIVLGMETSETVRMLRAAAVKCRELAAEVDDKFTAERLRQDAVALEVQAAELEAYYREPPAVLQ
jgi:hypothetical protein